MELLQQITAEAIRIAPEDLAALFKALAHPKRLAILQELRGVERCVCEIEDALDLRQAYVSQQLTVLREAGLVCYRKDGWNVYYRIARPEVYNLLELATVIQSELGTCAVVDPDEVEASSCGCEQTTGCPPG
ncbi:MAG: helix-turn-helix transcriptional regulator [Anaerolineae bacterium]|nr:helix-turn-helix transcriptional regulator [Anaerolineae bacterium]